MTFTHEITLDLSYNKLKTIHIKQYTKNCFLLHVSLTDRGEPFHADKSSQSCYFKMETPDKRYIFTDCTIKDDGSIDVPIPEGACLAAGNGTAELVFIKSEIAAKNNPQGASSKSLTAKKALRKPSPMPSEALAPGKMKKQTMQDTIARKRRKMQTQRPPRRLLLPTLPLLPAKAQPLPAKARLPLPALHCSPKAMPSGEPA